MGKQEWQHQLRPSLHPVIFAAFYFVIDNAMATVSIFPQFRAIITSVLPNIVQSIPAAAGDFFTFKLAQRLYGYETHPTLAAVCRFLASLSCFIFHDLFR